MLVIVNPTDIVSNTAAELGPRSSRRRFGGDSVQIGTQKISQFSFVIGNGKTRRAIQLLAGRKLVVIAVLAQGCPARKKNDRLVIPTRSQDTTRPGMRNDTAGTGEPLGKLFRQSHTAKFEIARDILPVTDLGKYRFGKIRRDRIHDLHQAIEGQLRTHSQQDHRILPQ